ncbi:MAG: LysR family transcriptional regulator [Clostridia bacterium]|nr:LysR family transcriptional regulator [Clostridia bacterium]
MNSNDYQYLRILAETGSFKAAAEEIHITQQGLSYAISKIERELGVTLFERTPRGTVLTEAGIVAIDYARRIDSLNEEMKANLSLLKRTEKRSIRIAVQQGMHDIYKIDFTSSFARENPDVEVKVQVYTDYEVDRIILNSECDIGFSSGLLDPEKFNIYPLDEVKFVAVMSSEHPLAERHSIGIGDLKGVKVCLANEKSKYYHYFIEMAAKKQFDLDVAFVFPELEYIPYVVQENLGIVISPDYAYRDNIDPDIVVRPLAIDDAYLFALVTERNKKPSGITRDFISYVTAKVRDAKKQALDR